MQGSSQTNTTKRLLPGSLHSPLLVSEQTKEQRKIVLEQMDELRAVGYRFFINYSSGIPENNYKDCLYDIGELQSHSFFLAYTFTPTNTPSIDEFGQFIADKLGPTRCLFSQHKQQESILFYVLIYYDTPRELFVFLAKHPSQTKLLTRLTWSIKALAKFIRANSSKGLKQFGEGYQVDKIVDPSDSKKSKLQSNEQADFEPAKMMNTAKKQVTISKLFDMSALLKKLDDLESQNIKLKEELSKKDAQIQKFKSSKKDNEEPEK